MGPLSHIIAARAVGASPVAALWMDLPVALGCRRGAEWTHGWPGGFAAALAGRRAFAAWCAHVALDTLSHDDGGATGKCQFGWLP